MPDTIKVQVGTTAPVIEAAKIPENVSVQSNPDGTKMTAVVTEPNKAKEPPVLSETPRPEWLPTNFKTVDDFKKSYDEAVKKITQQGQELADLKKGKSAQPATDPAAASVSTTPSVPGPVDLPGIAAEWAANGGKLTEASYGKLEAVGINKDAVNQYIAGQQALAERLVSDLELVAGGKDKLRDVLDYYGSSPELQAQARPYNAALASGDQAGAQMILRGMTEEYTKRVGRDPRVLIRGERAQAAEEMPFQSWPQVTAAMSDKRYKTDPIYRRSVERRTMAMGR